MSRLGLYVSASSGGFLAYWAEELLTLACGWVPTLIGIGLRAVLYRLLIRGSGWFAAEAGVRIRGMKFIRIEDGVYLDQGVYLHGRPGGLLLGAGTRVMSGAVLHVYNFRDLPAAGIAVGRESVIGFGAVITGQGKVRLGDQVIVGPRAMILPVNHRFLEKDRPIKEQGIEARGVTVEDGAWIGAGAMILDGVTVGRNAVVAAGAVVTEDVPAQSLVAGSPAKLVKEWGAR